jgi:hypothetical protein
MEFQQRRLSWMFAPKRHETAWIVIFTAFCSLVSHGVGDLPGVSEAEAGFIELVVRTGISEEPRGGGQHRHLSKKSLQ